MTRDGAHGTEAPDGKRTLVVRSSSVDDHSRDMIMTSDKIPKVIAALQHHATNRKTTTHAQVQADG